MIRRLLLAVAVGVLAACVAVMVVDTPAGTPTQPTVTEAQP